MAGVAPFKRRLKLLPKQKKTLRLLGLGNDPVYYIGALGTGKTEILAYFVLCEAVKYPGNFICVAAATYPQLNRSTIRAVLRVAKRMGLSHRYYKQEKRLRLHGSGSEIIFVSCDVPAVELQGPEFGALAADECEGIGEEQIRALQGRVRKRGASRAQLYVANPPGRYHWMTVDALRQKARLVTSTTYDNPILPKDYIRRLEWIYPPGTLDHRRYMLGEIGLPREGAVYPEYEPSRMIIDEEPTFIGFVNGLDLGANHPTAYLEAGLTADDVLVIIGEHYGSYMPIDEHVDAISAIYRGGPIFADHEAQTRLEYEFRGWPTELAPKFLGPEVGIESVRRRIITGRLKILRGAAPNLEREFGLYRYAKPLHSDRPYRDQVVKKDDDALDALRYLVTGLDLAEAMDDDVLAAVYAMEG